MGNWLKGALFRSDRTKSVVLVRHLSLTKVNQAGLKFRLSVRNTCKNQIMSASLDKLPGFQEPVVYSRYKKGNAGNLQYEYPEALSIEQ